MAIQIHGKTYITVAERLTEAHEDLKSVSTEVLQHSPLVVIKATVVTNKGTFTGISGANPNKTIEKQSPYEVAETSAVGRALGFAGYGAVESIASAEEMIKSQDQVVISESAGLGTCQKCGAPNALSQAGNTYCSAKCWMKANG